VTLITLAIVTLLLWRKRTQNLAFVPASADGYWDTLKERRRFRRFKKRLDVNCNVPEKGGNLYHTFSKDISGEGICLRVPQILPEGSPLELEIYIPDADIVTVKGEVVWVNQTSSSEKDGERFFDTGIRLLQADAKQKSMLRDFLYSSAEKRRCRNMNQTVSTFDKNKFEEIRIGVKEYKGFDLIDLRVWVYSKEAGGKVPTAKGLSLNTELFPMFKKAILDLENVLKKNNLIPSEGKE
jgi:hypothetical protein